MPKTKTQKKKLKWKYFKLHSRSLALNCQEFRIFHYDGRFALLHYSRCIKYFKKLSTAKKVAQLIYNG